MVGQVGAAVHTAVATVARVQVGLERLGLCQFHHVWWGRGRRKLDFCILGVNSWFGHYRPQVKHTYVERLFIWTITFNNIFWLFFTYYLKNLTSESGIQNDYEYNEIYIPSIDRKCTKWSSVWPAMFIYINNDWNTAKVNKALLSSIPLTVQRMNYSPGTVWQGMFCYIFTELVEIYAGKQPSLSACFADHDSLHNASVDAIS